MARRRQLARVRENPSTAAWVAIGLGVVGVSVGIYFLTRPSQSQVINPATGQPVPAGDKLITVTIPGQSGSGLILLSEACSMAARLRASGNSAAAATWMGICQQNGGTVA